MFLRESRAVQARSFHYHSEKALHETLPGKQGRLLVIFLPYYCQNLLYFTFYSRRSFSYYIPIAFVLSLSHLNAEMFGVLLLSAHTYNYWFLNVVHIKASTKKRELLQMLKLSAGAMSLSATVTKCWYSCQMNHWHSTWTCFPKYLSMHNTHLGMETRQWKH